MKNFIFFISAFLFVGITTVSGQQSYVLQNGSKTLTTHLMDDAISHIEDGDTLYLPGGSIYLNADWIIDKKVYIIGVGHYPDSTQASNSTYISGHNIFLVNGASGANIEGVYFGNPVYLGMTAEDSLSNISIARSSLTTLGIASYGGRQCKCTCISVSECVLRASVEGNNATQCHFSKNIINGQILSFNGNSTFQNNLFFQDIYGSSYSVFKYCYGLRVENNIFKSNNLGLSNSTVNNNIFVPNSNPVSGTNIGNNNTVSHGIDTLFVNSTSVAFSYDEDYHLHPNSSGIGAGTDGTDIGIYGTTIPYKEGAVPNAPHIRSITVSPETQDGLLPVNIRIGAQER